MIKPTDINKIRTLISNGELSEALKTLVEKGDRETSYYDEIIQLSGRYNSLDNRVSRNIITPYEYNQESNQISAYILNLLRKIDESPKEDKNISKTEASSNSIEQGDDIIARLTEENLEESLEQLRGWIRGKEKGSDYEKELAMLRSRYSLMRKEFANGTISVVDFRIESNQIRNRILDLVSKVVNSPIKEKEEKEKKEKIEESAASFVQESILALTKREKLLKNQAVVWYIIGFLALMAGVWVAIDYINFNSIDSDSTLKVIYQIFKSLFVIGLLVAASRYAFNLGKTYMNEALKNADRIHAISFGKFYLQVFGTNIKSEDLKEVFKDWNTVQESPFVKLNSDDFDPKMIDKIVQMLQALKSKE